MDAGKNKFGELLKKFREYRGLTKDTLAKKINKTSVGLLGYERGTTNPRMENVMVLADALDLSQNERFELYRASNIEKLIEMIPTLTKTKRGGFRYVPLLSSVQASQFKEVILNDLDELTEYIPTDSKDPDVFALRISGDCMEPEFRDGEVIVVSPNAHVNNGDYVVAQCGKDNEATFKQYKIYKDSHWLKPVNNKYEEICMEEHKCRIIGRVIWSGRKR